MPIDATQPYDDDNVFAKILRGEIPSTKAYEDDWAYAFEDINAQAEIHTLVVPKGRYVSWDDFSARASDEEIAGFVRAVGTVARQKGLVEPGYRLLANIGAMRCASITRIRTFRASPTMPITCAGSNGLGRTCCGASISTSAPRSRRGWGPTPFPKCV